MRTTFVALVLVVLGGCQPSQWQQVSRDVLDQLNHGTLENAPLTLTEIDQGLREALRIGSSRVIAQVGRTDGFNGDLSIHIPLPEELEKGRSLASRFGLERYFDEIEVKLNRAAEKAAPRAEQLFREAIQHMSLSDVRNILDGPDDAATRYFEAKMTPRLMEEMRPVIDQTLDEVGAIRSYKKALQEYNRIPFAPRIEDDLASHVAARGIDGIFHYLAQEEAAIRRDPVKRTTHLLRRVFGSD